jgi:hypothetical protein
MGLHLKQPGPVVAAFVAQAVYQADWLEGRAPHAHLMEVVGTQEAQVGQMLHVTR